MRTMFVPFIAAVLVLWTACASPWQGGLTAASSAAPTQSSIQEEPAPPASEAAPSGSASAGDNGDGGQTVNPAERFVQALSGVFADNGLILYATSARYDPVSRRTTVVIDATISIELYAEEEYGAIDEVVVLGVAPPGPEERQVFLSNYALCVGAVVTVLDPERSLEEGILLYANLTGQLPGGEEIARTTGNGIQYALMNVGDELAFAAAPTEAYDGDGDEPGEDAGG